MDAQSHSTPEKEMESQMVDALLSLQEIDSEIAGFRAERETLEQEAEELTSRLAELEKQEAESRRRTEDAEGAMRKAERTVQAGRATLKRLQQRAQEVHNMREHLAARAEVEAARNNLDLAETNLLEAMQDHERSRSALEAAGEALAAERAEVDHRTDEIRARLEELTETLAIEEDRRRNKALRIDEPVRDLYDRVRRGLSETALAPIVDGVCGHCFTAVPLQKQAEIRAGRTLIVCEACGVILHAER